MACDCKWSEAIEKRMAHVEHRIAEIARASAPVADRLTGDDIAQTPAGAPHNATLREALRASYAGARSAEVRGLAISFPDWLLSDLAAAGFAIVSTRD